MDPSNASILGLLESGHDPSAPDDVFPRVGLGEESGVTLAFGLSDNLFGPGEPDPEATQAAVSVLIAGREDIADQALSELSYGANLRVLMETMPPELYEQVAEPARRLLERTREYESAKWATLLAHYASAASVGLTEEEVERLSLLARHPELTPVATLVLSVASDQRPERLRTVIELAPHVRGWGLSDLIERRARYEQLHGDEQLDRLLLLSVSRNADGLEMELAHPLASTIGLEPWIDAALERDDDIELRDAVAWWLDALVTHDQPCGGIVDLPRGHDLLVKWCDRTTMRAEIRMSERRTLATAVQHADELPPQPSERWAEGVMSGTTPDAVIAAARTGDTAAQSILIAIEPPGSLEAARAELGSPELAWWAQELLRRHASNPPVQAELLDHLERTPALQPVDPSEREVQRTWPMDPGAMTATWLLRELGGAPAYRLRPLLHNALRARSLDARYAALDLLRARPELLDDATEQLLREVAGDDQRARARVLLVDSGRASTIERARWSREVKRTRAEWHGH